MTLKDKILNAQFKSAEKQMAQAPLASATCSAASSKRGRILTLEEVFENMGSFEPPKGEPDAGMPECVTELEAEGTGGNE